MKYNLSKRGAVRLGSFGLALVLVAGGVAWQQHLVAKDYKMQLETVYTRSLGELSTYLTNLSTDLDKGQYVGTPKQLSLLSAKIWRESGGAKSALSSLPVQDLRMDTTYKFLSQVGDYAITLSKKVASGQTLTAREEANAKALRQHASKLKEYVDQLGQQIRDGQIQVMALRVTGDETGGTQAGGLAEGFEDIEQTMTGYPTLIYDGPFSDHLLTQNPKLIQGMPVVSLSDAKEKAAWAAGLSSQELTQGDDENSRMPSYTFQGQDISVGITKAGGLVTYLINAREVGEQRVDVDNAIQRALQYLNGLGIEGMVTTYYEINDGICTINFASTQDGVILYTDLIKVGIALDDGSVVFYDGRGYINNHYQRTLSAPAISQEQAQQSLNPRLEVQSVRTALIPTSGKGEVLTYEFTTRSKDGQQILVYVNAANGEEEQILILIQTPNGTLTK